MSDDVNTIIKHQAQLAEKRTNWDSWWQDIAYRVMPSTAQFTTKSAEGEKRTERLFDANAVISCERFGAVLDDLLTPRTQLWHALLPDQDEENASSESKQFLERLNKALYALRYRPRANFAAQKHQGYLSLGAFGNSCLFIDEDERTLDGPRYRQIHMSEVTWAENHNGMIDTLYRKFMWSARKAYMKWGSALPEKIQIAAEKEPFKEFEFIHCVRPNDDRSIIDPFTGRMSPYAQYYVALEGKQMVKAGFVSSWPYAIGRHMLTTNETYGRSPAMAAWGAILTINEEKKTVLRAGQKEVDPPLLLQEDGLLEAFNLRPGALNYGAVSGDGTALVQPLKSGANVPLGLELMQLEKQHIEDSFYVTIFKILTDNPQMTATQVLEVVQQKATLLAPVMGRQHSEDLGPLIERELAIMSRMSEYAWIEQEMPEELRESRASYKIEYRSPLARAMRAQDGVAIMRTFEALPTAISIDPDAALVLDVKESMRELAEINGVPAKLVRDKKAVAAIIAQKREEETAANAAAVAPEMSQAALNAAKADQIRRQPAA
jgi:hypothetical protein